MADILHQFQIDASPRQVFDAFCTAKELTDWWPQRSSGEPKQGEIYTFYFGPAYDWRAEVIHVIPGQEITWKMTQAMDDWMNTQVGIRLTQKGKSTVVDFFHTGWPEPNDHYRISSFCWGTLLMGLKNYVENGIVVPFEKRQ